ncbi:hypothetical protein N9A93_01405, partial [Akkermansiaceae bacterium]|nr:hypothetical protein [Akkermansiaceae bacterium]
MIGSLLFLGCSEKDEGPKLDVELVDSRETSTTQEAEVWSTGVKEQLAELADTLLEPTGPINRASLAKSITTIDFQTKHQKERDAGSSILVRELSYSFSKTPMELGDFFKEMRTTLFFEGESDESHLKFKVYRVE